MKTGKTTMIVAVVFMATVALVSANIMTFTQSVFRGPYIYSGTIYTPYTDGTIMTSYDGTVTSELHAHTLKGPQHQPEPTPGFGYDATYQNATIDPRTGQITQP